MQPTAILGIVTFCTLSAPGSRTLPAPQQFGLLHRLPPARSLAAWGLEKDTPLIKHLFTTTMVLWSGGWCLLLLALFHLLFDCCTYLHWLAYPLQVIGCNALLAYLLAEVHGPHGHNLWWGIAHPLFYGVSRLCGEEHATLLFALCSYGLFWVVLHFLYKHKAFLRV